MTQTQTGIIPVIVIIAVIIIVAAWLIHFILRIRKTNKVYKEVLETKQETVSDEADKEPETITKTESETEGNEQNDKN